MVNSNVLKRFQDGSAYTLRTQHGRGGAVAVTYIHLTLCLVGILLLMGLGAQSRERASFGTRELADAADVDTGAHDATEMP